MGRPRRIHFPGAYYHVTARGNNKAKIFLSTEDKLRYKKRIQHTKEKFNFRLYSYTIIPNHPHLYLQIDEEALSNIMHSISTSYGKYFNHKYERVGHVFQSRYYARLVDSDEYSLNVVRYIHRNSVEAGLVDHPDEYPWCSHQNYIGAAEDDLVDTEFILRMFSDDPDHARRLYKDFMSSDDDWDPGDYTEKESNIPVLGGTSWRAEIRDRIGSDK